MTPANRISEAIDGLPFTSRALLAPMEGVTEPCYRDLVLERNGPEHLGGAFTEFVRVVDHPVSRRRLRAHLGPRRFDQPVGLQLMGSNLEAMAVSAERAFEVGAPLLDLNFGCPAKGALRGCAGSALLDDPQRVERLVSTVVRACEELPVTAKIRAGGDDDLLLEDLCRAVEAGGARLVTVHCRTRAEAYCEHTDWDRLRRAVESVSIPVCGNGGIECSDDLERMRRETGCQLAMVGRAALGDPWIFSGERVCASRAAGFLFAYAQELRRRRGAGALAASRRVKQLLRHWTAGSLVDGERRHQWLRISEPELLLGELERIAASGTNESEAPPIPLCVGEAP